MPDSTKICAFAKILFDNFKNILSITLYKYPNDRVLHDAVKILTLMCFLFYGLRERQFISLITLFFLSLKIIANYLDICSPYCLLPEPALILAVNKVDVAQGRTLAWCGFCQLMWLTAELYYFSANSGEAVRTRGPNKNGRKQHKLLKNCLSCSLGMASDTVCM